MWRSRRNGGLQASLRSRGRLPDPQDDIYVVDTLGELGLVYRLAPIVFVGGSLASHGGQNPVEPIKLGAAVLHGPHVWNFAEIYTALDAAHGAEQIADVGRLTVRVGALLTDAAERAAITAAARQTVERLGGALDRTVAALEPYLMQIRLERRGKSCVSRSSGGGMAALESRLLIPLASIYGAVAARRMTRARYRASAPVICIGNPTVGGAGKTPTALAVAAMLAS